MPADNVAWFEEALKMIDKDLGGALGLLSPDEIAVAKRAMVASLRATIAANPQGFRDMLSRLAPHKERSAQAAEQYPF